MQSGRLKRLSSHLDRAPSADPNTPATTHRFISDGRPTRRRYEAVFGRGFVSTGGETTTQQLLALLHLQPGQRVLDLGCGIGGAWVVRFQREGALGRGVGAWLVEWQLMDHGGRS